MGLYVFVSFFSIFFFPELKYIPGIFWLCIIIIIIIYKIIAWYSLDAVTVRGVSSIPIEGTTFFRHHALLNIYMCIKKTHTVINRGSAGMSSLKFYVLFISLFFSISTTCIISYWIMTCSEGAMAYDWLMTNRKTFGMVLIKYSKTRANTYRASPEVQTAKVCSTNNCFEFFLIFKCVRRLSDFDLCY